MEELARCTIFVMTDASPSGQTGFLTVLLGGDFQVGSNDYPCALMDWNITKVPKDGNGSFRPEIRGFYIALSCAMRLQTDIERVFQVKVPITIGTDSQSLLARLRSENTLREGENECFQEMEMLLTSFWCRQFSVAFVSDFGNLSDLMTKTRNSNKTRKIEKLQEIMNGKFRLEEEDLEKKRGIRKEIFENKCTDKSQTEQVIRDWRQDFTDVFDERVMKEMDIQTFLKQGEEEIVEYGEATKETWNIHKELYIKIDDEKKME